MDAMLEEIGVTSVYAEVRSALFGIGGRFARAGVVAVEAFTNTGIDQEAVPSLSGSL